MQEAFLKRYYQKYLMLILLQNNQSQGTGLGLYMTYNMIHSMNGTIEVENSTFIYDEKEYTGAKFLIKI